MPISTVLGLYPKEDATLSPTMGQYAHAAFFEILRQIDLNLADQVHNMTDKPFTVSPLQGEFQKLQTHQLLIRAGTEVWMRFTLLDDSLFEPFSKFFLQNPQPTIRLAKANFEVYNLISSGIGDDNRAKWSGHHTYAELIQNAQIHHRVKLRFYSPTAFRERNTQSDHLRSGNLASPDPVRCYQNWVKKWNAFSPLKIDKEQLLRFVQENVRVSRLDIETKMLDFGKHKQLGFIGNVEFQFNQDNSSYEIVAVNLLSDFAFYAGTGIKTAMGMGQTRRI